MKKGIVFLIVFLMVISFPICGYANRAKQIRQDKCLISGIKPRHNSKPVIGSNSYIKILTPIQFTLETCNRANDDKYLNFLMTSPRENTFYSFKTEKEINHFNMRSPHIHDFYELLSYNKSKKLRQKFFSKLTYRALWNFSLPMLTGGALCISL